MPALLRLRTAVAALAAVAVAALPAAAQSVLIDFAEFRSATTTEYQATPGGEVTSQGFDFYQYAGSGPRNALGTWGTAEDPQHLPTNLGPTAAALWGTDFGVRMDMEASDGRAFNLYSMDVAHLYNRSYLLSGNLSAIQLYFYGFNAAGQNTVASFFTIPAPAVVGGVQAPSLTTLLFGTAWRGLSSVAWFQGSGAFSSATGGPASTGSAVSHQFTNVAAEVVPEPSTYLLVAAGLGGVLAVARRRARA